MRLPFMRKAASVDSASSNAPMHPASLNPQQQSSKRLIKSTSNASTASDSVSIRSTGTLVSDNAEPSSAFVYDDAEGVYSGWLYVYYVPTTHQKPSQPRFVRRFCELRELVCTFYESENVYDMPLDRHVIIAVERIPSINKGFMVTDHTDRKVSLHPPMQADFEDCYEAFASVVRQTQIAKPRAKSTGTHRQASHKAKARRKSPSKKDLLDDDGHDHEERNRSFTDSDVWTNTKSYESTDRAVTCWLYLHLPWWRLHRRTRRYFVVSNNTISCFSLNKEGQSAEFVREITNIHYDPAQDPLSIEIQCQNARSIHLSANKPDVMKKWVHALHASLEL